jgi:hypothetical protein
VLKETSELLLVLLAFVLESCKQLRVIVLFLAVLQKRKLPPLLARKDGLEQLLGSVFEAFDEFFQLLLAQRYPWIAGDHVLRSWPSAQVLSKSPVLDFLELVAEAALALGFLALASRQHLAGHLSS